MKQLPQWKIVTWDNQDYKNGGETFDSITDAETWIEHYTNEAEHDDLFVVPAELED